MSRQPIPVVVNEQTAIVQTRINAMMAELRALQFELSVDQAIDIYNMVENTAFSFQIEDDPSF